LAGLFVPRAFDDVPERAAGPESSRGLSSFQEYLAPDRPPFSDSIILGAPAVLFALCGAWAGRRGRILLLGGAVFALASTGAALGIDRLLFAWSPLAGLFRYAEKLIAPGLLLLSLAAALGIDRALGTTVRAAGWFAAAAGTVALACFAGGLFAAAVAPALAYGLAAHGTTHDPSLAVRFLAELRAGLTDAAAISLVVALAAVLRLRRSDGNLAVLGCAACAASVLASSSGLLYTAPIEILRGPFPLGRALEAEAGPSPGRWRLFVNPEVPAPPVPGLPERQSAMA